MQCGATRCKAHESINIFARQHFWATMRCDAMIISVSTSLWCDAMLWTLMYQHSCVMHLNDPTNIFAMQCDLMRIDFSTFLRCCATHLHVPTFFNAMRCNVVQSALVYQHFCNAMRCDAMIISVSISLWCDAMNSNIPTFLRCCAMHLHVPTFFNAMRCNVMQSALVYQHFGVLMRRALVYQHFWAAIRCNAH